MSGLKFKGRLQQTESLVAGGSLLVHQSSTSPGNLKANTCKSNGLGQLQSWFSQCLPRELRLDPLQPSKKPDVVTYTCNPSIQGAKIEGSLGLTSQPILPISEHSKYELKSN